MQASNIWGRVHHANAHLPEFEVRFERWSNYLGRHEVKAVFFRAESIDAARALAHGSYGALIDILSIEEFI